jgi:hypothetical protein
LFSFFKKLPEEAEEAVELAEAIAEDDEKLSKEQQRAADEKARQVAFEAASIQRQTDEIVARRDARPQVSEVSIEDFMEAK